MASNQTIIPFSLTPEVNTEWTMKQALDLIRWLQPILHEMSWHVALGGGVLNKGKSNKDLDLYFFPFGSNTDVEANTLLRWLRLLWGEEQDLSSYPWEPHSYYAKVKFMLQDGHRIDAFVHGGEITWWKRIHDKVSIWIHGIRHRRELRQHGKRSESIEVQGVQPL